MFLIWILLGDVCTAALGVQNQKPFFTRLSNVSDVTVVLMR
jgi:hypothetical protein